MHLECRCNLITTILAESCCFVFNPLVFLWSFSTSSVTQKLMHIVTHCHTVLHLSPRMSHLSTRMSHISLSNVVGDGCHHMYVLYWSNGMINLEFLCGPNENVTMSEFISPFFFSDGCQIPPRSPAYPVTKLPKSQSTLVNLNCARNWWMPKQSSCTVLS